MKPPSSVMGGGYRRKADQETVGRNSRVRYDYLAFDKRMIPYSSARLRENVNRPNERSIKPDMGQPFGQTVAANFDLPNNGILPNSYSRLFDVLVTDISALTGTLYRIETQIEILANTVLGTSAHTQNVVLASSIGRAFLQSQIDNQGYHRFTGAEYSLPTTHKQKLFQARRIRALFYNIDSGSPVLEETSAFTEYFCYSPTVGIGSTINASINYSTPNNTVFDSANNSATARIFTRFDNIQFTGDSDNQLFKLVFNAQSTTGTPTKVFYTDSHAFYPANGVTGLEQELLQPDGPILENYSVNNHDVDFIPVAWPPIVKKELGYGWDPTWYSAASVSPSVITTFYINYAVVKLVAGNTASDNIFKFFDIQMDSIVGTDFANVGTTIEGSYTIETLRSGQSNYQTVASNIQTSPLNPAVTTPATLHSNALRTLTSNPADDIRGPIVANLYTTWSYTNTQIMNFYDLFNAIAVPPYFNSISMAIQNETQAGYDIVVTAYDGFTAFNQNGASGETPYVTCELFIKDAGSNKTLLYSDLNILLTGYSLSNTPFTIKQVDRSAGSPDLSWFPANYTGGHTIDINLKYTFSTSGYSSFLQSQVLSSQVTAPFLLYSSNNLLNTSGNFSDQSLTLWSLEDHETLPFTTASSKAYTVTLDELPQEHFNWKITVHQTVLADGASHNVAVVFGPSNIYAHGTNYGFRLSKEGNNPYIFTFPTGSMVLTNFGAALSGLLTNDVLKWTLDYDAATTTTTLTILKNGTPLTLSNGGVKNWGSNWLAYTGSPLHIALNLNPANIRWDKVLVERTG